MHNLATAFVLGYHGCDVATAEKLLQNKPFIKSENDYDWLGSGIYFWEANPDRALHWAKETVNRKKKKGLEIEPAVIGAVVDLGFCLDLISANGIEALAKAYEGLQETMRTVGQELPKNLGNDDDLKMRHLDCAVVNYLHATRERDDSLRKFDTVRGVFTEGQPIYPKAGFREKTHIQICVRNPEMIKGVFRVPKNHFSK